MTNVYLILCVLIIFVSPTLSIVNTETFFYNSKTDKRNHHLQLNSTLIKGNSDYVALETVYNHHLMIKNTPSVFILNYNTAESKNTTIQNKGFLFFKLESPLTNPQLTLNYFIQKEFNEFTDLQDRNLIGSTISWKYQKHDLKTIHFNTGLMIENEKIDGLSTTTILRSTSYIAYNLTLNNLIKVNNILYLQPKLDNFSNIRILGETSLFIPISENIHFNTSIDLNYNSAPASDIEHFDIIFKQGLNFFF